MNFSSPDKVLATLSAGDEADRIRAENRVKINEAANGFPPFDLDTAKKQNLKVNVNWGELAVLFSHALQQLTNAFQRPALFFKIQTPLAPKKAQPDWGRYLTNSINRVLKKSRPWFFIQRDVFQSIIPHGLALRLWPDHSTLLPEFIPYEDWRVATDTNTSLDNLEWFAILDHSTEGELSRKVFSAHSLPGWNKTAVASILKAYHSRNVDDSYDYDWSQPEKMAELVKQNSGYYQSDAVPTIPLWRFYFKGNPGWKLVVLPHSSCRGRPDPHVFLYESEDTVADKLEHLIQIQIGDLSTKAPAKIHSVRSLGFMLLEPTFWTNLARCRGLQHLFESFNVWLRCADPSGHSRAQKIEMFDRAFLPEGVSVVPQNERHQINPQLMEMMLAQLKQLMNEASSSYTQQSDTGTQKEQTAFETSVKLSQVTAMLNGILTTAFFQETFVYQEICRRFCLRNSDAPEALRFQKDALRYGIPKEFLNEDLWDIQPEIPMGLGNPTMEMAQSQQLLALRPMLNPNAQQEVLHESVSVITGDPRKATRWVPLDQEPQVSDAATFAITSFAPLMLGIPVPIKPGLNLPDQISTLLGMMAGLIMRIKSTGPSLTPQELAGLQTVAQHIHTLIQQLSQDLTLSPLAKQFAQALSDLLNEVKTLAANMPQPQNNGAPAESQAKIIALQQTTQAKLLSKSQSDQQKLLSKSQSFQADQSRKNLALASDQARLDATTASDIARQNALAQTQINRAE